MKQWFMAAPAAPPPLTEEIKEKLASDPWDDAEREILLGLLRKLPPHTPKNIKN